MGHFGRSLTLLVLACMAAGCGSAAPTLMPPPEPPSGGIEAPVYIESAEVLVMESFPIQVAVHITGELPSPCHQLQWSHEVLEAEGRIEIEVHSVAPLGLDCIQVLEPFDESLPLGAFESGSYEVLVNGEVIGAFDA